LKEGKTDRQTDIAMAARMESKSNVCLRGKDRFEYVHRWEENVKWNLKK
jgi:hypothetical protein